MSAAQVTACRHATRLMNAGRLSPWGWQLVGALLRVGCRGVSVYRVAQ